MTDTTSPSTPAPRSTLSGMAVFTTLALVALVLLVGVMRLRPPLPAGLDAPQDRFSEERARGHLAAILGAGAPRPLGSAAHAASRDAIVARLRSVGLEAKVTRTWHVVPSLGRAAWLENITASVPGMQMGPPILVVAHYDSVGAGPGAADNGVAVAAAIEVARAVKAAPVQRTPVEFLFTDGEESGLLGAHAFLQGRDPSEFLAVLNFDARGNTGPSLCFETGDRSASFVAAWASHASRPLGSSAFVEAYARMPNSTDFTLFGGRGFQGINFAAIGRVHHYHTALDSLANVDPALLQHHGDNMLAAVRGALDESAYGALDGVPVKPLSDAVWFDVLGLFVVRWGTGASVWIAAVAGLLVVGWILHDRTTLSFARGRRCEAAAALFAWPVAAAAGAVAVWGAGHLVDLTGALGASFPAEPEPFIALLACAAVAGASLAAVVFARWASAPALVAGGALWMTAAGVFLAVAAPRVSYIFVAPVAIAGVLGFGVSFFRRDRCAALVAGALAAGSAVIAVPFLVLVPEALGLGIPLLSGSLWLLVALPLIPCAAAMPRFRWVLPLLAAAGGVAANVSAAKAVRVDEDHPTQLTMVYRFDPDDPHAHLFLKGDVPPQMRALLGVEGDPARILPWERDRALDANTPKVVLAPPVLEGLVANSSEGGGRRVTFRLKSARGASRMWLVADPATRMRSVTLGGTRIPVVAARGGYSYEFLAIPAEGVDVTLDVADSTPVMVYVADWTPGLPAECASALRLRPRTHVASHWGDSSIAVRRLKI